MAQSDSYNGPAGNPTARRQRSSPAWERLTVRGRLGAWVEWLAREQRKSRGRRSREMHRTT